MALFSSSSRKSAAAGLPGLQMLPWDCTFAGKSLGMGLPGDLGFFLFWVMPEISQVPLTSSSRSPQPATSGVRCGEWRLVRPKGRNWVNFFKVQTFNFVLISSRAKGSSRFLLYPSQLGNLQRPDKGVLFYFQSPQINQCLHSAPRHLKCHQKLDSKELKIKAL